jgi:TPR repeat protein
MRQLFQASMSPVQPRSAHPHRVVWIVLACSVIACGGQVTFEQTLKLANRDPAQARASMEALATGGDPRATIWLMGQAVAAGLEQAEARAQLGRWAELCARQGNAECQEVAGLFYWAGAGGRVDFERAEYWFAQAARQGNMASNEWLLYVRQRQPIPSQVARRVLRTT